MQFCPACGAQQSQAGQFCRGCGADLRVVRTALQTPIANPDTGRLEIARAMTAKIAALDPNDRRLAKKIATIREEADKLLESSEERRKRQLLRLIAMVGGGVLVVMMGLIEKVITRGNAHDAEGMLVLVVMTVLATLTALLLANIFPRNRRTTATPELPITYPASPARTSPTVELPVEKPMLAPPSVTEGTTYNLPPIAVPVPVAERNTR